MNSVLFVTSAYNFRMASEAGRTIIIDYFDESELDIQDSLKNTTKNDCFYVLKREKSEINGKTEGNYVNIECVSKLEGFYKCKENIDATKSIDVTIICCQKVADYWFTVCSTLFTSAYQWKISALPVVLAKFDDNVLPDIDNFVRSYRATGSVKTFRSKIISETFVHGFTSRNGGLSTAPGVASLNMIATSEKRDSELIGKENLRRLAEHASFDQNGFVRAKAVHGNTVFVVGQVEPENGYDAVVSNQKGTTVAAPGADCCILLFADEEGKSFGACHSGWKGTLAKVCIETVKKMEEAFDSKKENIKVVFGPSIGTCCLEFGEKDAEKFKSISEKCIIRKEGANQPYIDLHLANRKLLESYGVLPSNIDDTSVQFCTSCNPDLFFSFRRDGKPFGNQVGFIGLQ